MKTSFQLRSSRTGLLAFGLLAFVLAVGPVQSRERAPVLRGLQSISCHYTYGGETNLVKAEPVASPYTVPTIQIGSFFLFRVVWQAQPLEHAAVNVYTYADGNDGPIIIHHAAFASPRGLAGTDRWGFTGLQRVYEPTRDGELEYWCERTRVDGSKR